MFNLIAGTYFGSNVSDIEILWTLISLIGMLFSIHNMRESRQDLIVLKEKNIRNGRWKIALTGLRAEVGRLYIQGIFFSVGVFAMLFPEPPVTSQPIKVEIFRFLFQWGFITSSVVLTLKSYWNYQLRRELVERGLKLEPHETEMTDNEIKVLKDQDAK